VNCQTREQVLQLHEKALKDRKIMGESVRSLLETAMQTCRRIGDLEAAFPLVELHQQQLVLREAWGVTPVADSQPRTKQHFLRNLGARIFQVWKGKNPVVAANITTTEQTSVEGSGEATEDLKLTLLEHCIAAADVTSTIRALHLLSPTSLHDLSDWTLLRPISKAPSSSFVV